MRRSATVSLRAGRIFRNAAVERLMIIEHVLDKHSPHTTASSLSLRRRPARPCLKDQANGSATPAPTAPLPPHWTERPAVLSAQTARMTGHAQADARRSSIGSLLFT